MDQFETFKKFRTTMRKIKNRITGEMKTLKTKLNSQNSSWAEMEFLENVRAIL